MALSDESLAARMVFPRRGSPCVTGRGEAADAQTEIEKPKSSTVQFLAQDPWDGAGSRVIWS